MSLNPRSQRSVSLTRQSRRPLFRIKLCSLLIVVALALTTYQLRSADVRASGKGADGMRVNVRQTTSDADLLAEVSQRILAVTKSHPKNIAWPPMISLINENKLNAYATLKADLQPNKMLKLRVDSKGRYIPYVGVDQILMNDIIQGDSDRLAMVIGHEVSHILLGHVMSNSLASQARTLTSRFIFTSEQEHEADINGIKLALAAGYTYKGARGVWEVWSSEAFKAKYPTANYTSFESVGIDHPSWSDRLSYIDKEKANVWRAMSAFENGALFLSIEQYAAAEEAFTRVVNEFPDNYEGWANLGYARLMLYLDAFDAVDLKRYDIGQIVVGSFYQRPEELRVQVRGVDAKVWQRAVSALNKALELKPTLCLAKANLGVAYLLNPDGKDAKRASELLEQAVALLDSDKNLDGFNRGAVLINAAAADLANGQADLSQRRLDQARSFVLGDPPLSGALEYNSALLAARPDVSAGPGANRESERLKSASSSMGNFLETTSPASIWWGLGYDRYVELMKTQGLVPKDKPNLTAKTVVTLRPIPSVEIEPGVMVTLSDRTEDVRSKIETLTVVPVVKTISMFHHPSSGSDLLAGHRVVAIFLHGTTAPKLKVQPLGTGAQATVLSIGMTDKEVGNLLRGIRYKVAPLDDPTVTYYFYPELGIGIRYDPQNRVSELVLAQIVVQR